MDRNGRNLLRRIQRLEQKYEKLEARMIYLEKCINCLEYQQHDDTKKLVTLVYNRKGGEPR
ncbi:hypothetical protein EPH95_00480 [Salicibibacter halophilus]|uniref:Uncharacterized protein n=1 Tax=Salicibibacter halophilus TaxID=2502791 RepID=A0A514LDE2_9BACI|nr:hypothetical protein [Salicibibacter halophilus]QDI89834.1 hypothetical protein EPH95_00480 [Salicibibacter halophilus]